MNQRCASSVARASKDRTGQHIGNLLKKYEKNSCLNSMTFETTASIKETVFILRSVYMNFRSRLVGADIDSICNDHPHVPVRTLSMNISI